MLNVIPIRETMYSKAAWPQPEREHITLDDTHAMMSQGSCDKLLDYSCSMPSGVWIGKMWKCKFIDSESWFLRWFGTESKKGFLSTHQREILIAD